MDSKNLKEFCKNIGLDLVGIAGVGPYKNLEKTIKQRLVNGYVTGMEEMVIENRIQTKNIMPNAKSIIVCAIPYYIGEFENSNISNYCYGKDYHIVIKNILQKICDYISSQVEGFEYKYFVDNGPLVDRHLAYLAGIGYYGINNSIITDKYGSYVFIGYIVNNVEFIKDEPLLNTCIKCGKCVKYCPGNALLGNYDMNPKRCLSYITQKKGELTKEEENLIKKENKVFGCDVCQMVCPHNYNIDKTQIEEFNKDIITKLENDDINAMSNKEFKRLYGDRAFSWRGKNIIKRNLQIVYDKSED